MEKRETKTVFSNSVDASSMNTVKTVFARPIVPTSSFVIGKETKTINAENCTSKASEINVTKYKNDGINFTEYLNGLSNEVINNHLDSNASSWWAQSITFVRDQVKKESYNLVTAAKDLYRQQYNIEVSKILDPFIRKNLEYDKNNINNQIKSIDDTFLAKCHYALLLSNEIYDDRLSGDGIGKDATTLTFGSDGKADCQLLFKDNILWVVTRGTRTVRDMISDLSFLVKTTMISNAFGKNVNAEVPEGVFSKSCEIEIFLLNYLEELTAENKVNHIYFVGHSLGGSISTALLVMHKALLNKFRLIPATAITVGAPLIFSNLPKHFYSFIHNDSIGEIDKNLNSDVVNNDNEKDIKLTPICNKELIKDIHDNIHNIVYQLDIMPRLLGQHEMPQYIKDKDTLSYFDKWAKEEGVHRTTYSPFGKYYLLKDSLNNYDLIKSTDYEKIYNDQDFVQIKSIDLVLDYLSIFSLTMADFIFSGVNDHSVENSLAALKYILNAKNNSNLSSNVTFNDNLSSATINEQNLNEHSI